MVEKRKEQRKHLSLYLRVQNMENGDSVGHLVDMTPDGVRILTNSSMKTDIVYKLGIDLSMVMNFEQRVVFDASCVWQEQEFSSGAWNCGFTILKITNKGREILEMLVDQFGD